MSKEDQTAAFRRWYAKHRSEFNARRRKRYAADSEYRKKCVALSARARQMRREQEDSVSA